MGHYRLDSNERRNLQKESHKDHHWCRFVAINLFWMMCLLLVACSPRLSIPEILHAHWIAPSLAWMPTIRGLWQVQEQQHFQSTLFDKFWASRDSISILSFSDSYREPLPFTIKKVSSLNCDYVFFFLTDEQYFWDFGIWQKTNIFETSEFGKKHLFETNHHCNRST